MFSWTIILSVYLNIKYLEKVRKIDETAEIICMKYLLFCVQ